ncbi:MAG: sodium/solute symporter [Spirochaetales bacterium]|nr:sodium/solute symporter [Spirochaetales bacterium]MCF7938038.1 sodium/solute symporter [Spirochaetales bacterium]
MLAVLFIGIFIVLMVVMGILGMKRTSNLNDFFLGGRKIGPWVSAVAYGTSYFSAVVFIGFAGKLGWGFGANVLWIALGNTLLGSLLAWFVLGRRTRTMSWNLDVMTMPEFLQERYNGRYIKMIAAVIIFVFLLPYSASVFKGLSHLFEANFGISYDFALLIMILITGVYLVLGGYFAITLTDFIQGMIMVVGSIAMVAIFVGKGGGLEGIIGRITEAYSQHVPKGNRPGFLLLASLVFMTSFGTWGLPQMIQKYYAIKNEKQIKVAAVVTTIFALVVVFAAYFTGSMSHLFFEAPPIQDGVVQFDIIIPQMLTRFLPSFLMAVILLLVLSASMSTLSSLVLVSASSVAIDLYKGHIRPDISKEHSLFMMRFLSGLFVALSFFIARYQFSVIVTLMSLSWGAVAGAFMAPYLYSLYWKRTSRASIVAGMLSGLIVSVGFFFILGADNSPIASAMGMITPFIVVPLVTMFTPAPEEDLLKRAFQGIGKASK